MRNKVRLLLLAGIALPAVIGFCLGAPAEKPLSPSGVWAHGDTVLVFASFPACEEEGAPPSRSQQTLVSQDGGKTWAWRGPLLTWSVFDSILDTGEEIWLAGYEYSAEGPGYDPFVLRVDPDAMQWPRLRIYEGEADSPTLAHDKRNGNRFVAWVAHLMPGLRDPDYKENDDEPTFLHESLDRGQTWHVVRKVKSVPKSASGLHFFQEIPRQSGAWRIANADQLSTALLEHREANSRWEKVQLPSPVQICEEGNQLPGFLKSRP